jgi:aspartate beta-hydroxylase
MSPTQHAVSAAVVLAASAVLAYTLYQRRARIRQHAAARQPASAQSPSPPTSRGPAACKKNPAADSSSSDSDDDDTEKGTEVWKRVEGVLAEYSLTRLGMAAARKWVKMMGDPKNKDLDRLREWLLTRVNGRLRAQPKSPWQSGCPEILGGLRAKPVWDVNDAPFLKPFEDNFEAIRDELLSLRSQRGFQPLKIPNWASKKNSLASPDGSGSVSHDAGNWNVFYLFLHEVQFPDNLAKCPVTTRLLNELGSRSYQHAFFSALTPGTHIVKHHGPTNKKLRCHLPLVGAAGSELRVADDIHKNEDGKVLMFDDSFEHEAWHRGDSTRIVLVFDVWHPDLTDKEVQFLSFLQRSRMRAEMAAEKAAREQIQKAKSEGGVPPTDDAGDNFYQLLQEARDILPDNNWWVQ